MEFRLPTLTARLGRLRQSAASFLAAMDAAIGRKLPPDVTPELHYRARVLVALVGIFNLAMLMSIPLDASNENWGAVAIQIGWGAIVDVLLVQALKRGRIAAMGHFVSGVLVINLTVIAQEKGGLLATELTWQCAAILFATLVLGPRGALVWTLVAIGALVLHVGRFDPTQWHGAKASINNPVDYGIDLAVLYLATWGLAFAFDRARAKFFHQLGQRNNEMRRVLDHVGDALLIIDRSGRIGEERSARADALLGKPPVGAPIWEFLGTEPENAQRVAWLEMAWEAVLDDFLPRDAALEHVPRRVSFNGRALDLQLTVLEENGAVSGALVVLHDVTDQIAHEAAERARREVLAVFEHVRTDPNAVADFVKEMDRLVESATSSRTEPAVVMRDIHTIKGNSALFGVESLASVCHSIEDRCAEAELEAPSASDLERLATRWRELSGELREWSSALDGRRLVPVARPEIEALRAAIAAGTPPDVLTSMVGQWELTPAERVLSRLARQGQALAAKLGKDAKFEVEVSPPSLRIDTELLAPVISSLVHGVRNALDHGIASRSGTVTLRAVADPKRQALVLEVADDGEGIAWDAVRRKAQERGLPSATPDDLMQALLADGFSTRDEATSTSGRGVGLAGMRQAAEDIGGSMLIRSDPGEGSRIQIRLPLGSAPGAANSHKAAA